jgi:hypothetical protein
VSFFLRAGIDPLAWLSVKELLCQYVGMAFCNFQAVGFGWHVACIPKDDSDMKESLQSVQRRMQ